MRKVLPMNENRKQFRICRFILTEVPYHERIKNLLEKEQC